MPSLVLASSSPRRAALLSGAGFEFEIAPPRLAEKFDAAFTLRELTLWNAIRKGMSVAQTRPDAVVIAADTLVALGNEIIGKPSNLEEAAQMLRRLSGQTHEVCSAVLIYHQTSGRSAPTPRKEPVQRSSQKSKAHSPTSSACQWRRQSLRWPNSAYGQKRLNGQGMTASQPSRLSRRLP